MASSYFETGVQLFKSREFKNAQKNFETALTSDPKNTLTLRYLGYTCFELKDYEAAKEALDRALSLKPTEFYYPDYKRLAEACQETGEPHRAVKFYRTAIELEDKQNTQVLAILWEKAGNAAQEFGDIQSSITFYNEAIKLNPNVNLYYNIARLYKAIEKYSDAITYFKKALEYNPENIEALYALAYLQGAQNQYDEAEKTLEQCERVCTLKGDDRNLKYCKALGDLIKKKKKLPLSSEAQRLLSEEETKIKYLLNKHAKSKKYGEVMQLQPVVEVLGPINTEIKLTENNYTSFLISNGSPDETVELSFSINLKKALVEPKNTTINLEPGEFSELKFKVTAENAKLDTINGQVKITSKVLKKKTGSVWDVFRTMTDILIPFGGLMVDLVRKPFTKPDASKDFIFNVV